MHQPQCVKGLLARPIPIIRAFLLCLLLLCSQLPSVVGFFSYAEAADSIHGGAHPLLVRSTASAHVGSSTLAQTHKASKFANVHVDHRKTASPHTAVADPTGTATTGANPTDAPNAVSNSINTPAPGNSVNATLSAIATGGSTYTVGQTVSYTLNAQIAANSAPIPAGTSVTIEDVLPVGLTGVTASAPNGGWSFNSYAAVSPSDIIATYTGMSSLNAGATLPTLRITATIQPGITQTFTNTALLSIAGNTGTPSSTSTISISSAKQANPVTTVTGNGTSAPTTVTNVTNGTTTLSITPVGGSTYTAGQSVTYNLRAIIGANLPVGSTVVVTSSIPQAGLSNILASSSTPATLGSWRFSIPNTTSPATVTGTFVSTTTIPAGTKLNFTITGKTNASVAPTFTTNATLSLNGTTSSSSSSAIASSNAATAGNPSDSGCASCSGGSSCSDISVCSACANIAGCSNASGSTSTTSTTSSTNTTTGTTSTTGTSNTTTTGNTACADISVCSACASICSNASGNTGDTNATGNTTGTSNINTTGNTTGTSNINTTGNTTGTSNINTTGNTTGTSNINTNGGTSTIGNTGSSGGSFPVGSSGGSVGLGIPTNAVSLDQTTVRGDSYHVGDVVVFVLTPYIESNPSDIDNPGAIQLNDVVPVGATNIRVWGKCWQVEPYDKAGPTLITASLTCPDSLTAGPKLPELRISLRLTGNNFPTGHDAHSCKAASAFTNTAEVNVEGGNASRNNISAYTVKVMRLCHPYGHGHGNSYGHGKVNGYPGGAGSSAPAGGQGPQTSLPALPLTGYDPKER